MATSRLRRITINNNSGNTQSYALFAEKPVIDPALDAPNQLANDFICTFRGVSGQGGQALISMPYDELQAICGARPHELVSDGVQIEVLDHKPVRLGYVDKTGQIIPGTTCDVNIASGCLQFDKSQVLPDLGDTDAFCVRTKPDFSYQEAQAGNYLIGYGLASSAHSTTEIGPFCSFRPAPNTLYKIRPGNVLYCAAGNYEARTGTPPGLENQSNCCKIDFDLLKTDEVTLVHTQTGALKIQSPLKARI